MRPDGPGTTSTVQPRVVASLTMVSKDQVCACAAGARAAARAAQRTRVMVRSGETGRAWNPGIFNSSKRRPRAAAEGSLPEEPGFAKSQMHVNCPTEAGIRDGCGTGPERRGIGCGTGDGKSLTKAARCVASALHDEVVGEDFFAAVGREGEDDTELDVTGAFVADGAEDPVGRIEADAIGACGAVEAFHVGVGIGELGEAPLEVLAFVGGAIGGGCASARAVARGAGGDRPVEHDGEAAEAFDRVVVAILEFDVEDDLAR